MLSKVMTVLALSFGAVSSVYAAEKYPEFGGRCAYGVAIEIDVATDCSQNWTAPNDNFYCFGSEDDHQSFMKDPESNLEKAFDNYEDVIS